MLDQTMIHRYLDDVDSYLHVGRAHRKRILAEIQGHLHDAAEAHVAQGLQPQQAMQRAMEDIGPPQEVAVQFSPIPPPARSVRGWRRWTPILPPTVLFAGGVAGTVHHLDYVLRYGLTRGAQIALPYTLMYTAIGGAISALTFFAIRKGDQDRSWRKSAWILAAIAGLFLAFLIYR